MENNYQNIKDSAENSSSLPIQKLPYSTPVLILGILSIIGCCFNGLPGLILGIIALILASKGKLAYHNNPAAYSESSVNNLKAGKVCAIIGIIFSVLLIIFLVILFSKLGWDAMFDQELMLKRLEELLNK